MDYKILRIKEKNDIFTIIAEHTIANYYGDKIRDKFVFNMKELSPSSRDELEKIVEGDIVYIKEYFRYNRINYIIKRKKRV